MTIQLISGNGYFSINGTQYPTGSYRVVIHGDNIGITEVGSSGYVNAVNPEFYGNWDDETGTPYATKQDLLDDLQSGLFTAPSTAVTNVIAKSIDYTANNGDVILVDASGGDVTITVPEDINFLARIKKIDNSVNKVIVVGQSGLIDGASNAEITIQYNSITLFGDGTNLSIH